METMETATTMTQHEMDEKYASHGVGTAALTTGIIGTALAGLGILCGGALGLSKTSNGSSNSGNTSNGSISGEENYIERKQAQDYLNITRQYYEGKIDGQQKLADAFFDSYKRDVDNSFGLYKNQRDLFDAVQKEQHDNYDALNQKIIDSSFGLYKSQRDTKDALMGAIYSGDNAISAKLNETAFALYKNERDDKDVLNEKINNLQSKVDVMAAVRPYQDALINAKIDQNALLSDFKLQKRTCKMIEGTLVLPDNLISGFTSYNQYQVQ